MLDTETKRRIDTARDILVGKVPDPKSQVEQITIALIYKFMDDMDAEAEELGGNRKFFTGEFARYGWAKLMAPSVGGHEMLGLYGEGIQKMPENPGIPLLFRDIFKNAYLPYRDPETLKAFLKIINEFTYDHSERLGDAFEYLLSVLGSQGDAGQFRTPRHIIDFIVAIIDPKKTDVVLDPACGTAGFLISAYKHILKANTDAKGKVTLTPDERGRLATNVKGYDISPDMVRLSLVNLYLHGFTDPHVYEYDTLTSEDRWNEFADVILANPPFMSPKGGIKPHKRFSIQAKRSEVLFVDYIAEHLTPTGRAGIIVPEGIIFQSQTAYAQLRKLLVENSLVAVVSLPAGCFNPYSGVKTSILILDKSLAKAADTIAFFKVENDGFGLGAQRRAIDKNDLPLVQVELAGYLEALRGKRTVDELPKSAGLIVPKDKIAENGDYNLSGERYREGVRSYSTFPFVSLEEVFVKIGNGVNVGQIDEAAKYRVTRIQTIADGSVNLEKTKHTNDEVKPDAFMQWGDILLSHINSFDHLGKSAIFLESAQDVIHGINLIRFVADRLKIDPRYAISVFKTDRFIDTVKSFAQKAVNQASVKTSDLRAIKIPLPSLDVQKEIVAEIERYQKVIDGARAVLENYRPHIPIDPEWPMVEIKEVAAVESGYGFPLNHQGSTGEDIPFLKVSDMNLPGNERAIVRWNNTVSRATLKELKADSYPAGTVIFPKIGAAIATNKKRILTKDSAFDNNVMGIIPDTSKVLPDYLHTYLLAFDLSKWASDAQPPSMRKTTVELHKIPLPLLEIQSLIVAEIEAEQALVSGNRELIARFEKKIQSTLARVWGETPSALAADAEPVEA